MKEKETEKQAGYFAINDYLIIFVCLLLRIQQLHYKFRSYTKLHGMR